MKHLLQTLKTVFLSVLLVLVSSFSLGETTKPVKTRPTGFLDGIKAYQKKDYQRAKDIFKSLSEEYPDNPNLLFNLGLSEFKLGRQGLALGLWHQVLFLDRGFSPALEAINYTEHKLFPVKKSSFFIVSSIYNWLTGWSLHLWILLSLSSLFGLFWFSIEYGIKLKKPPLTWSPGVYSLIPIVIVTTSLSFLMYRDQNQLKAVLVQKYNPLHASPSSESPSLSELREGELVIVKNVYENWIKVRSSEGLPGWVSKDKLYFFGKFQKN